MSALSAHIELPPSDRDFAQGLLLDLVQALREARPGDRIAFTTTRPVDEPLERWASLTGHAVVGSTREPAGFRYVVRSGAAAPEEPERPIGSRLWLYTNFHCNLACDYCCVRSSPVAVRDALGLERVQRLASEAAVLRVEELFLTGGEPFLLPEVGAMIEVCAAAAPITVLTNGILLDGSRRETLVALPRDRVTLQVSVDSATPELHDRHRGAGAWAKAWRGIRVARELGFRVRIAATVHSDEEAGAVRRFLEREGVASEDQVVRRVALRGFAPEGVALSCSDLVPEPTITARGVYWHPVGATDPDFLVTTEALSLSATFEAVRAVYRERVRHSASLSSIFFCA